MGPRSMVLGCGVWDAPPLTGSARKPSAYLPMSSLLSSEHTCEREKLRERERQRVSVFECEGRERKTGSEREGERERATVCAHARKEGGEGGERAQGAGFRSTSKASRTGIRSLLCFYWDWSRYSRISGHDGYP